MKTASSDIIAARSLLGATNDESSFSERSREDMGVVHLGFCRRFSAGCGTVDGGPVGAGKLVCRVLVPSSDSLHRNGGRLVVCLGHPVLDDYLVFAAARCRPNTVLAAGYDLKVFFSIVAVDPVEVSTADVLGFVKAQRSAGPVNVIRLSDGESGLSSRTIQRRLLSIPRFPGRYWCVDHATAAVAS